MIEYKDNIEIFLTFQAVLKVFQHSNLFRLTDSVFFKSRNRIFRKETQF